jgi:glutathione synthase/RimK-type ligase-like ATP-grasp enzyme
MPNIGILYGMESTFPYALVQRINSKKILGLSADHVRVGGVKVGEGCAYNVIIDRVSRDIDFYRAYLKNAVLAGSWVLNNPFRWTADDKLVHYAVAKRMGILVPHTVVIPQKSHPPGTTGQSMRNLAFPLDWEEIFGYVTFPAYLKPVGSGGWMSVQRVDSPEDFFGAYDQTASVCMLLQCAVAFDGFFRAYVVGQQVRVVRYDRRQAQHRRHVPDDGTKSALFDRLGADALKLCRALGYDINAVDFAVQDGTAYLIDSYNLAPDADSHSVGRSNFEWLVESVAELAIARARGNADPASQFRVQAPWASAASALL